MAPLPGTSAHENSLLVTGFNFRFFFFCFVCAKSAPGERTESFLVGPGAFFPLVPLDWTMRSVDPLLKRHSLAVHCARVLSPKFPVFLVIVVAHTSMPILRRCWGRTFHVCTVALDLKSLPPNSSLCDQGPFGQDCPPQIEYQSASPLRRQTVMTSIFSVSIQPRLFPIAVEVSFSTL